MIRNEVLHTAAYKPGPHLCALSPCLSYKRVKKKYNAVNEFLPFLFSHKKLLDSVSNFEKVYGYFFVTHQIPWMKKTSNLIKNQPQQEWKTRRAEY